MRSHALVVLALVTAACSSSGGSSSPCNEDPWQCPSTQTCWPQTITTFACLNAGPGVLGGSCDDLVGTPTCGAGLVCFQTSTGAGATGSCVASCSTADPSHACPIGQLCETASLQNGPRFNICLPHSASADDAGSPTGASDANPTDAGTDAGATDASATDGGGG